ncbi:Putative ACR protein [Cronobacter muytjensii 530]
MPIRPRLTTPPAGCALFHGRNETTPAHLAPVWMVLPSLTLLLSPLQESSNNYAFMAKEFRMQTIVIIANGAAYGSESLFNCLRLAIALRDQPLRG